MASAILAALMLGGGPASPKNASEQSLVGELICQTCYLKDHHNVGPAHLECATICAKRGAPLAVLTGYGKIYVITGNPTNDNNARLRPYLGQMVEVVGQVLEQRNGEMHATDGRRVRGRLLHEPDGLIIEARDIGLAKQPR